MRGLLEYRLTRVLVLLAFGFTTISVIANAAVELATEPDGALLAFESYLDAVAEHTVQSWFSSILLAGGAALASFVAVRSRGSHTGDRRRWIVVASGLWWVSLDETVGMHEMLNDPRAEAGVGRFAWIAVGVPVVVAFALLMLPIFRRLEPRVTTLLVLAGVVYVGGAMGVEFVSGFFVGTNLVYGMIAHAEELLEMLGAVIFIEGMLRLHGVPATSEGRILWDQIPGWGETIMDSR